MDKTGRRLRAEVTRIFMPVSRGTGEATDVPTGN